MKKKKGPETATDYHAEFSLQPSGKTPEQLTEIYNREGRGRGWNSARSVFLHELRCALSNVGLDFSCLQGTSGGGQSRQEGKPLSKMVCSPSSYYSGAIKSAVNFFMKNIK